MSKRPFNKGKNSIKLPPGQRAVRRILRWGIDHPAIISEIPKLDLKKWKLHVDGEVEKSLHLSWEDLLKLTHVVSVSDFHCVEGWSVLDCRWGGVLFKTLIEEVKPRKEGKYVFFECADSYTTCLSLKDLLDNDVILAYELNGEILEVSHGGPLRLVVPNKYGYKSAMWITRIRFIKNEKLGFWEKRGYSNTADVWRNDRYAVQ